jgi:hypothetical protein
MERYFDDQLDLFPAPRDVARVDPLIAIGPATRVRELYRVRLGYEARVHQVFHDRYGWYCAEHGRDCAAVAEAKKSKERAD